MVPPALKRAAHTSLQTLELLVHSPLYGLWLLTNQQPLITADLQRWVSLLGWPPRSLGQQLLLLLARAPEFRNLFYFRLAQGNPLPRLLSSPYRLFYPPAPTLFLDRSCTIGPGLFIQHGFSTIIMADLGADCWINQQVTIGHKDKSGRPRLGDRVRITAGAKVIGSIRLGSDVTVGANAVVTKDVPDRCVVVGIPAYIVRRDGLKTHQPL